MKLNLLSSPIQDYPKAAFLMVKKHPICASIFVVVAVASPLLLGGGIALLVTSPFPFAIIPATGLCLAGEVFILLEITVPILISQTFYKSSLYVLYKKKHRNFVSNEKDVLLVLIAKADHNGFIGFDRRKFFRSLEKDYTVIFRRVSSLEKMKSEIADVGKKQKISSLWVNAHGNPCGFIVGEGVQGRVDIRNYQTRSLASTIKKHLTPHGTIILDSCSTGGRVNGKKLDDSVLNIAETLALKTQKRVYASSRNINFEGVKIVKKKSLKVKFRAFKKSSNQNVVLRKTQNVAFFLLGLVYKKAMIDSTCVYHPKKIKKEMKNNKRKLNSSCWESTFL